MSLFDSIIANTILLACAFKPSWKCHAYSCIMYILKLKYIPVYGSKYLSKPLMFWTILRPTMIDITLSGHCEHLRVQFRSLCFMLKYVSTLSDRRRSQGSTKGICPSSPPSISPQNALLCSNFTGQGVPTPLPSSSTNNTCNVYFGGSRAIWRLGIEWHTVKPTIYQISIVQMSVYLLFFMSWTPCMC